MTTTSTATHHAFGTQHAAAGASDHHITMHTARVELGAILRCDPRALPDVFYGTRPRALKIGIYYDLLARYPGADAQRLRDCLGRYTATRAYLRRIVLGRNRHDLDGNNAGAIDAQSRARARARIRMLDAARAQRAAAATEAHHAAN